MHELSICEAVIVELERVARQHGAQVIAFTLRIGPLSGVEAALIERAFPLAAAGTPFSSSRLVIESMPITVRCSGCERETVAAPNRLVCAACGDWRTDIVSGAELLLASVELERSGIATAAPGPESDRRMESPHV